MSKRELVNCDFCGRDTSSKSRICQACFGEEWPREVGHYSRSLEQILLDDEHGRDDEVRELVEMQIREQTQ